MCTLPRNTLDSKMFLETAWKFELLPQIPMVLIPWLPLAYIDGRKSGWLFNISAGIAAVVWSRSSSIEDCCRCSALVMHAFCCNIAFSAGAVPADEAVAGRFFAVLSSVKAFCLTSARVVVEDDSCGA